MSNGVWEIEEDEEIENIEQLNHCLSIPTENGSVEDVYVAVGKMNSSMDALYWALKHVVNPSKSCVYLVHVFPQVHHIPTPLGMLPKSQVSSQQVESYMIQERTKRREMLQKFLNACHSSKVQVDVLLIESDLVAKAVIELIPVLNIKKIVVGTTKSSLRKMKKGSCKAEQIHKNAPQYCEVKIICDGKEVMMIDKRVMASSSPAHSDSYDGKMKDVKKENENKNSVSCICFSPRKFM